MAEETTDQSFLHLLRRFATPARDTTIFKDRLPAAPTLPSDALDFRFAVDTIAQADAATTAIADAMEKLLQAEESVEIEDRSLAPASVDPFDDNGFRAPSEAIAAGIEAAADQGKNSDFSEERLSAVFEAAAENGGPKSAKSAADISKLILERLCQIEGFPKAGIEVTVYGFGAGWNAMLTFSPGSTTVSNAMTYRKALPVVVAELRNLFELI
jgi:hypothetical protein